MDSQTLASALEALEATEIQTSSSLSTHGKTSNKSYRNILKYLNVTSFSQLDVFNRCPRKFQKSKERAAFSLDTAPDESSLNVDFAFGHAVGSGIQNFLITGNLNTALLNCMLAWRADFFAEIPKKKKSIWSAMIAVEKFAHQTLPDQLGEWELLILPNGKPAIETSFSFHCGNGFKHYGHMDIALRNKRTQRIMVVDCKTTGFADAEESLYANSTQALSYGIMLETCLPDELMDYEVMYLVYSAPNREWTPVSFTKSVLDQAEFIKDLLLTHDTITSYSSMDFWPKRGNACYEYFRRCEFYGECNLTAGKELPRLGDDEEAKPAEEIDYVIDLNQVIENLKARRKT